MTVSSWKQLPPVSSRKTELDLLSKSRVILTQDVLNQIIETYILWFWETEKPLSSDKKWVFLTGIKMAYMLFICSPLIKCQRDLSRYRIVPILTSSKYIMSLTIPHLYRHITFSQRSTYHSFLNDCNPESYRHIQSIRFLGRNFFTDDETIEARAVENLAERLLAYDITKRNISGEDTASCIPRGIKMEFEGYVGHAVSVGYL